MRVLVLGASGMLGHKLVQRFRRDYETAGTIRDAAPDAALLGALGAGLPLYCGVSGEDLATIARAVGDFRPDVIVNAVGIIKQLKDAKAAIPSIRINSLLPHELAALAGRHEARLVHFSTDCVFSGKDGNYIEEDAADARDLYGRSKLLGEVDGGGALTIRSSIVGRELRGHLSLIDWFLSQRGGRIKGYRRALYSGLTTNAMADLVAWLLAEHADLSGLWHVSSEPISKYDLLGIVNDVYGLGIAIEPDDSFFCDRRLDSSRFRQRTGWQPPSWADMIRDMHGDPTAY